MKQSIFKRLLSAFVSLTLVTSFVSPALAFAAQPEVQVENHTTGEQAISKVFIDGVDEPSAGNPLDDKATVTTAEGASWDIPVLWIGDDLQLATEAAEGRTYLPALAFFVPQEYGVEGNNFTVTMSDSLTKLFGDQNAVSVFDSRTGITYILPISLRNFFASAGAARNNATQVDNNATASAQVAAGSNSQDGNNEAKSVVDIFCAQTARNVLTDEDLEYLIDLVLHTLEPQAVNLLLESFPSFKAAAEQGQIGTEIGLYIYYRQGDKDGKPEHESASNALAYVSGDAVNVNGTIKYCYMIGIDVYDLVLKDGSGPVRDQNTGKFTLVRDGESMVTFSNTIVHELFHAIEDDYNRTGMLGAKTIEGGYTPNNRFTSEEQRNIFYALYFPKWFIEGTASSVENVYQFRYDSFKQLRATSDDDSVYEDSYEKMTLLYNYLNSTVDGKPQYYGLEYAYGEDENKVVQSRYVTGYLAVLYLGQLAAQKDPSIGTAVDSNHSFSSANIRLGLDSIMRRMHNGESLDHVINDISSIDGAAPMYKNTEDFEDKFIKGAPDSNKKYYGDTASINFTLDFLNYMRSIEKTPGRTYVPNGSILFDFDGDFNEPLDRTKKTESDFLKIVYSNEMVESTVPSPVALAGGGKSDLPSASGSANQAAAAKAKEEEELPLAAKTAATTEEAKGKANGESDSTGTKEAKSESSASETSAAEQKETESDDADADQQQVETEPVTQDEATTGTEEVAHEESPVVESAETTPVDLADAQDSSSTEEASSTQE